MIRVEVCAAPFDVGVATSQLITHRVGGVANFVGIVRNDSTLLSLTLEHYPGMTDLALRALAQTAFDRWDLLATTILHRVGVMTPGDPIVFVGTASSHRAAALEATAFLIDRLKTDAPFWKRETFADGRTCWVEARDADGAAARRWIA